MTPVTIQQDGALPEAPVSLRLTPQRVDSSFHNGQMITAKAQLPVKVER